MSERLDTSFEKWVQREGIPIVRGYFVPDLYQVQLEKWPRKGGLGAHIILEGGQGWTSAYVCEIPPHTSLKPQQHLFEEMLLILQGQGETQVWNEASPAQRFAWHEYSLFSPPLNAWHQHINTGDQPVKYVAVTDAPVVFNIYRNPHFVFNTNFVFDDRYRGEIDYFKGAGKMVDKDTLGVGLVSDVRQPKLPTTMHYGKGYGRIGLQLSGNTMGAGTICGS